MSDSKNIISIRLSTKTCLELFNSHLKMDFDFVVSSNFGRRSEVEEDMGVTRKISSLHTRK